MFYTPEEKRRCRRRAVSGRRYDGQRRPHICCHGDRPTGDDMTVTFKQGERYELGDEAVTETEGVSNTSGTNGQNFAQESGDGFPWQQFDIKVGEQADENGTIRINWEGTSNNEKTFLYVYNTASGNWDQADAEQTTDGDTMTLTADVALADYLDGSVVHVMVQNGEAIRRSSTRRVRRPRTLRLMKTIRPERTTILPSWWKAIPSITTRIMTAIPARMWTDSISISWIFTTGSSQPGTDEHSVYVP